MEIINKETTISVKTLLKKLKKEPTIVGVGYGSELFPYQLLTEPYVEIEESEDGFLKIYNKVFVPHFRVTDFNNFSIVLESAMLGYTTKLQEPSKNTFDIMTTYKEDKTVQEYAVSSVFEEPTITKSSFTINKKRFTIYKITETQITSLDFKDFTHTMYLVTTEEQNFEVSKLLKGRLSKTETHHLLNLFSGTKVLPETVIAVSSSRSNVSFDMYEPNGFILIFKANIYELGSKNHNISFHKDLIKGSTLEDNSLTLHIKNKHDLQLFW
ncbi:hypothetical protein TwortDSMZ_166 [Staphylococcus phage Twort]|uniref:Uncharacterized protein n=2 Tax=Staphylococcus phage Twort (strain DSM 17442 / HER 48) TaxID=2908167 RepID=A0A6H0X5F7_BPTWO|nr:ORF038 [Staphylococcus phage Twort]AAX92334.1 ORF038 [Staphylococcus phage Twort]QIW89164.1 hypothetical protein TwortDSMZ_166 [Staphylococcus phage Twort]